MAFTLNTLGQQKFNFDTEISYEYSFYPDSTKRNKTYWTSSNDNSYFIEITKDSANVVFTKFNRLDELKFETSFVSKNASKFSVNCKYVSKVNDFKGSRAYRYYNFTNTNDSSYTLKSTKSIKFQKRRKIGSVTYTIEKHTQWHLPLLLHYIEKKKYIVERVDLPNGIFKFRAFKNHFGQVEEKWVLTNIQKIDKTFYFSPPCKTIQ